VREGFGGETDRRGSKELRKHDEVGGDAGGEGGGGGVRWEGGREATWVVEV